jgi:hypothetical protein
LTGGPDRQAWRFTGPGIGEFSASGKDSACKLWQEHSHDEFERHETLERYSLKMFGNGDR